MHHCARVPPSHGQMEGGREEDDLVKALAARPGNHQDPYGGRREVTLSKLSSHVQHIHTLGVENKTKQCTMPDKWHFS